MTEKQARIKEQLMVEYGEALDKLLSRTESAADFAKLEKFSEELLPKTLRDLSALKESEQDFSP